MPGEDAAAPAQPAIGLGQHLAEGQNRVEPIEIERRHLVRGRDRAMMRVVEQEDEGGAGGPASAELRDDRRIRPFVDDHHIHAIEERVEVGQALISPRPQLGKIAVE